MDDFHAKLNRLMSLTGISIRQVSKQLKVAYSAAHNWSSGKSKPSPEHLIKLAELLGVSPELLSDDKKSLPQEMKRLTTADLLAMRIYASGYLDEHVVQWANKGKRKRAEQGPEVTRRTLQAWLANRSNPTDGEWDGICELLGLTKDEILSPSPSTDRKEIGIGAGPETRRLLATCYARTMVERRYVEDADEIEILRPIAYPHENRIKHPGFPFGVTLEAALFNLLAEVMKAGPVTSADFSEAFHKANCLANPVVAAFGLNKDETTTKKVAEIAVQFAHRLYRDIESNTAEAFLLTIARDLEKTEGAEKKALSALLSLTKDDPVFAPRVGRKLKDRLSPKN